MHATAGGPSLLATEGPIVLGYLAVAGTALIFAALAVIFDPETRARRIANAAARAHRRKLAEAAADLDTDALLDYPTAGGPR